ncbi:MAG: acetate/propionate family kinase [Nitrospirales bacterium]|nr:acetate/propionate family kinase [Nitrospirales bacterium]
MEARKEELFISPAKPFVLAINGGSSSIKFGLYETTDPPLLRLSGKVDRIGLAGTSLTFHDTIQDRHTSLALDAADYRSAANFLITWITERIGFSSIMAAGHRVVYGLSHTQPERITQELLDELRRIRHYDPEHLPQEINLIEVFHRRCPELPQIACFDTAFHQSMPRVARLLPIPRRFDAMGIRKYGFHGLSYSFLMEELERVGGPEAVQGKVVLAHLGNGSSLAAVRGGQSIDTTMGFTPTAGLPMSSRSGDLDPGVAWYLMKIGNLTPTQFNRLVNHESGLLGVSETSSDLRDLLGIQQTDPRAAEAVELFCYHLRRWIGSLAAVLEGIDQLVFSGGIGENAAEIRSRVCTRLGFLGIKMDEQRNEIHAPVISAPGSPVTVRVIRTDEELMIAKTLCRMFRCSCFSADSMHPL